MQVSVGFLFLLIDDPTFSCNILYSPAFEPSVVSLNWTLKLVITEWNFPEISVISNLEGEGVVLVFVDFEDKGRCELRILNNAAIRLVIECDSFQVVFIDAVNVGHVQTRKVASNRGIMSTVEDPLHSALILGDSLEVVVGLSH